MTPTAHRQLVVAVALLQRHEQLLIVRRHDPKSPQWHQLWGFPGGKIEIGETPLEALHRELNEETRLTFHSEQLLGVYTHHWDTPKGIQQTFILLYHCLAHPGEVILNFSENDAYLWEKAEALMHRSDMLDGNQRMLQELWFSRATSYNVIP